MAWEGMLLALEPVCSRWSRLRLRERSLGNGAVAAKFAGRCRAGFRLELDLRCRKREIGVEKMV
jgi:hypothetical protein